MTSTTIDAVREGPDEAVTTALLKAGSLGNVRSETLRGFTIEEATRIILALET